MELLEDNIYSNENGGGTTANEEEGIYEVTDVDWTSWRNESQTTVIQRRLSQPRVTRSGSDGSWKRPFLVGVVCLGLLYVLQLALIIGLYDRNITDLEEMMTELSTFKTDLKLITESKVAFAASLGQRDNFGPFDTNVTLVFEDVLVNIGEAYNSKTGIFTAPLKGVYFFIFTGHSNSSNNMGLWLIKDGSGIIASIQHAAGNRLETSTNSISLVMEKNEQLYLQLSSNTWIFDNMFRFTTFMGQLLFPL